MAVTRGEVWTVSGGAYAGKPRPAIIVRSDQFDYLGSITLVPCTTDATAAPLLRLSLRPTSGNGLRSDCRAMIDKITTVPRTNLGTRIGVLAEEDMLRINRALVVFLGIG
jgi:mRNA interferase MazF